MTEPLNQNATQRKELSLATATAADIRSLAATDPAGALEAAIAATDIARRSAAEIQQLSQMPVGKEGLEAKNSAQLWWLAGIYCNSGVAPKDDYWDGDRQRPEREVRSRLFIKMSFGAELGIKPLQAIQSVAVINNRPCLWGDAMKALVLQSGEAEYVREKEIGPAVTDFNNPPPDWGFECRTKRHGQEEEVTTFTWSEAMLAGLVNKNKSLYKLYPKRMMMFRARGFRLRDTYPDVLRGLISAEEARDLDHDRRLDGASGPSFDELAGQDFSARPVVPPPASNGSDADAAPVLETRPDEATKPAEAPAPTEPAAPAATEASPPPQIEFNADAWVADFIGQIGPGTRMKQRRELQAALEKAMAQLGDERVARCVKAMRDANWL